MRVIAQQFPELRELPEIYERFVPLWYEVAAPESRAWLEGWLNQIEAEVDALFARGPQPPNATTILLYVTLLRDRLSDMKGSPPL